MEIGTIILLVVGALLVVYGIAIYNGLVTLRNRCKNAFSQIDVQLKRRYDLIPNLVEVAKNYLKHERETLEAVIEARNQAMAASQQVAGDPSQGVGMTALIGAEAQLAGAMGRLFAVVESYPDLKANQNMSQLHEELTATENRVTFARQAFNDAVMVYNIKRESFPDTLVAGAFGFKEAALWELQAGAVERETVRVSF